MKEGDYVRTKCYGIQRITGFISDLENDYIDCDYDETTRGLINKKEIIKYSPNIIDLIEVGDYVNGILINNITIYPKVVGNRNSEDLWEESFKNDDIKSIVTKEQFESMEYRIGE